MSRSPWLVALVAGAIAVGVSLPQAAAAECPNQPFRVGRSAQLPDCRAYELVTPTTNGRVLLGLPQSQTGRERDLFPIELSSPDGESFVSSTRAAPLLSLPLADGREDGYEARRAANGWQAVRRVTPSGQESVEPEVGGLSSDHHYIFVHAGPTQNEGATSYGTLYDGSDADYLGGPDGRFELTGVGSLGSEKLAEGRYITPGGEHVIFTTGKLITQSYWCYLALFKGRSCLVKKLESNAPESGTGAIYDRAADGPTHVVSLLPSGDPPSPGEESIYLGSSKDASSIAFEIDGTLYVRADNGIVGAERTEEAAVGNPTFAGFSDDGRYLLYVAGGDIYRFDTTGGGALPITATGDARVANLSADGSHVYFISESQIGGQGISMEPNLYVWSAGTSKYIKTLVASDVLVLGNWTQAVASSPDGGVGPGVNSTRTTPDGRVLLFASAARLLPYDNAGRVELYRYSEDSGLACVSCNPTGTPATADARLQDIPVTYAVTHPETVIDNLSADGSRVFFETTEALAEDDKDGINDIYEWQEPVGGGQQSLDLISSGSSTSYPEIEGLQDPNVLMAVTPSGDDVFFRSTDPLVPGAALGGAQAIYDARVVGGFPQQTPADLCSGEDCQSSSAAPPSLRTAASVRLHGAGNVRPRKRHGKHRCHRPRKKHRRCTRKHARRAVRQTVARSSSLAAANQGGTAVSADGSEASGATSSLASPVASAAGEFEAYGLKSVAAEISTSAAARHPDLTTNIVWLPAHSNYSPQTEDVVIDLPPGLYGNPNAAPRCATGEFISNECSPESQVGLSHLEIKNLGGIQVVPVYNLEPPHPQQEVARFGLLAPGFPIFIDVSVRTAGDYGVTAAIRGAPAAYPVEAAETTIWANPGSSQHDAERFPPGPSAAGAVAFMTNPSACQQGNVDFSVTSYQFPGQFFSAGAPLPSITDCSRLPFEPSFSAEPTSHAAGAPTGLKTTLVLPQHLGAGETATATMREARVALPEGMQIAAGAANWIGTCSEEQVGFHREVDAACPDASRLGTATITSPVLSQPLNGFLFQRRPSPGHQFGLWLVSDELGMHVKLPGELEPDPDTGRLTAVFKDLPQVPVSQIDLEVWGGPRAPLQNPDSCGTYVTDYSFKPHSEDPAVTGRSQMQITEACDRGFDPKLDAGVTKPVAGRFSPLIVDLTRPDGDQALRGFELKLPDGELAKLKGVRLCPDADAAAGNCPAASRVGSVTASVGPGPEPLWVPQPEKAKPAVYLAGPHDDSPFSLVTVVPAQAGPFDLGNVVVRSGLGLDPDTNRAVVKADPLPQFFEGVGFDYRRLHVVIDRPKFSLNPTDCRAMRVESTVASTGGTLAHPSSRFQLDGCKRLRFKPTLSLTLQGGTNRSDYPALTAVVKARKGDANIARTSVALPHSEFLAQEHIVTICTRKQFAADRCPKGSIYGQATAWTPLLNKPLKGPVYLRSSDNLLPDLVAALGGELDVNLVGRIDSPNETIRTTFAQVPDAPVTRFVLRMRGGKKGLLVNSVDICRGKERAQVAMRAQNGRALTLRPELQAAACGK